ncbi:hypothetical protein DE146DRAFT_753394 [Phaeosphaeria sp. MPI-PUGE-AT-0046c]|nr:hypothetical protein DE146DRAFT_753394 [Phaeosphaeria sp. MPI-PUGE-AT-0046c]
MHVKSTLFTAAAALSAGAVADFLVVTNYPQALQTLSPEQADAWISSNLPSIQAEFASLATDASYLNAAASVIPALRGFAATATVSVPAVVTALDDFTIYTSPPAWYTQLPTGVRAFYDDAAKRVESYVNANLPSNVPANSTGSVLSSASHTATASSSASGSASGSVSGSGSAALPESTGAAGTVETGVMGAGLVAGGCRDEVDEVRPDLSETRGSVELTL